MKKISGLTAGNIYNFRVVVTDKAGNSKTSDIYTWTASITLNSLTDIGKYINYTPSGGSFVPDANSFSNSSNKTFTAMSGVKWRIWKVDDDKIYLISDQPACSGGYAQGTLRMGNMGGYVDGVRVIDEICNACFKNNSYPGMEARNLKIEDIEEVTKYEYMNDVGWGNGPFQSSNCKYPSVWETYEKDNLFATRSISYGTASWTTKVGTASITTNSWSHNFTEDQAATEWVNPIYYELVISNSLRSSYPKDVWLSSRSIMPCSSGVGWRNV